MSNNLCNSNISYQSYDDFQNQTNGINNLARQSIDTFNYDLDQTSRNNQSPLVSFQTNKTLVNNQSYVNSIQTNYNNSKDDGNESESNDEENLNPSFKKTRGKTRLEYVKDPKIRNNRKNKRKSGLFTKMQEFDTMFRASTLFISEIENCEVKDRFLNNIID